MVGVDRQAWGLICSWQGLPWSLGKKAHSWAALCHLCGLFHFCLFTLFLELEALCLPYPRPVYSLRVLAKPSFSRKPP